MSVLVSKRKKTDVNLDVFSNAYQLRRKLTDRLLFDFGFKRGELPRRYKEESEESYNKRLERFNLFYDWYIPEERKSILEYMRNIITYITVANSIYPTNELECDERRVNLDRAVGYCYSLVQEMQYVIETLPVDVNEYTTITDYVNAEIELIIGVRQADNRFKKQVKSENSSTNFANVNNNGNSNNNNSSNSNGVVLDYANAPKRNISKEASDSRETSSARENDK